MRGSINYIFVLLVFIAGVLSGCKSQPGEAVQAAQVVSQSTSNLGESPVDKSIATDPQASIEFRLKTQVKDGQMVYVGVGGEVDGVVNPDLIVQPGVIVRAILVNGDGIPHDLSFPDFKTKTPLVSSKGKTAEVSFTVGEGQTGDYPYFCTQPGHRQTGQEGKLRVLTVDKLK